MSESVAEPLAIESAAKLIVDLDNLIQAMRRSLRPAKSWQRTVLAQLADIDRQIEVLRLAIVLEREDREIVQAADAVLAALALRDAQLAKGRADETTRAAFRLALGIARRIPESLTALSRAAS